MWWPGTELNRRRQPFQGCALPPELPGHFGSARAPLTARVVRCAPSLDGTAQLALWERAQHSNYNNLAPFAQSGAMQECGP